MVDRWQIMVIDNGQLMVNDGGLKGFDGYWWLVSCQLMVH